MIRRHRLRLLLLVGVLALACARDPAPSADALRPVALAGESASAFPAPDRPVARIVTDTWSDERSRDDAGEAERVMEVLDTRPGRRSSTSAGEGGSVRACGRPSTSGPQAA